MGFLTRLFGQTGKIRFEYTELNGNRNIAKCKFESFNMDIDDIKKMFIKELYVDHGIVATKIRILGVV